jgi:hypothetical protein
VRRPPAAALIGKRAAPSRPFFFSVDRAEGLAPMDQIEIWNSAFQMVRIYQHFAEQAAARRADDLLDRGDIEGFEDWTQIVDAIRDLEHKRPIVIDPMH